MMSGSNYVHKLRLWENIQTKQFLIITRLDENPQIRFLNDHFSISIVM